MLVKSREKCHCFLLALECGCCGSVPVRVEVFLHVAYSYYVSHHEKPRIYCTYEGSNAFAAPTVIPAVHVPWRPREVATMAP